jgi:hypothetical protein
MQNKPSQPFPSIESALEFMTVLQDVVADVSAELGQKAADAVGERYADGLHLALYKMNQLSGYVEKSRTILKDLALIRKVLCGCEPCEVPRPNALNMDRLPQR